MCFIIIIYIILKILTPKYVQKYVRCCFKDQSTHPPISSSHLLITTKQREKCVVFHTVEPVSNMNTRLTIDSRIRRYPTPPNRPHVYPI